MRGENGRAGEFDGANMGCCNAGIARTIGVIAPNLGESKVANPEKLIGVVLDEVA